MKKYITIAALLAAGTAFANAETVFLDSAITNTSTGDIASVWAIADGKQKEASAVDGISAFDRLASSSIEFPTQSFKLSDLYNYGAIASFGDAVVLDTFSILGHDNKSGDNKSSTNFKMKLTGTLDGVTVEYVSASLDNDTDWSQGSYGARVFSFENAKLDVDSEITVSIEQTGFGFACVQAASGYTLNADAFGTTQWVPVYRAAISPVPEPSAFGLLAGLGALALVASRRRRSR
ncbi:MAG: PEP-CTERM sorting domain-containing protein [Opitutales bacterium]|nr:PEP-CTERM sorting domain-containing protein [Opitutales bacterium]